MINRVLLIGNLGIEPEIRTLETGVKVARLRLATTEKFTNQTGEKKEHTEWHTIVLWRSQADFAEKYLHKGSQLYIEGKIRSRERIDENGGKKTIYEIHADEVRILGKKEVSSTSTPQGEQPQNSTPTFGGTYDPQPKTIEKEGFTSDNLPF